MRLLKRETTVPIPTVFDFLSTTDNVLHCPYIIVSYVPGRSLYDVWFARQLRDEDADSVHRHRVTALKGIASAMAQLSSYTFEQSGSPKFHENGNIAGLSSIRYLDNQGMLDRWFIHQDPSDDPIYVKVGPFSDYKQHFLFPLEFHPPKENNPDGLVLVLRQLIRWLPEPGLSKPFVLAHPDFDIQNFLVAEDGTLQAIIDWDGICAVPRSVGNESLPGWLIRDWDPGMYGYQESMDNCEEPEGVWEDPPTELARYRSIYRELLHEYLEIASSDDKVDYTSISLIAENLSIAARDPACRHGILEKIVREISTITSGQFDLDIMDLAAKLSDGDLDEELLEILKTGFQKLLQKANSL